MDSLVGAEWAGARRLGGEGLSGAGGGDELVEGVGPDSTLVSFRPDQVHSIPIKDPHGDIFGVSFPTKDRDEDQITAWSQQPTRTSDFAYVPVPHDMLPRPDAPAPEVAPDWVFRPEPAPWGADVQRLGYAPVYVDAHGNSSGFGIGVDLSGTGSPTVVRVDGTNFGRVLAANPHFRRALVANPQMPVLFIPCDGAPAAEFTAAHLQNEAGIDRDVHAATGLVSPIVLGDGTSWLAVEQKDGAPPYRSFPYPRDSAGE